MLSNGIEGFVTARLRVYNATRKCWRIKGIGGTEDERISIEGRM